MAIAKLRCNLCERELQPHCPSPHNHTCTWMRCTNHACSADLYDVARGILRHRDGRQEGWDDQPTTDQPPTVTVVDDDLLPHPSMRCALGQHEQCLFPQAGCPCPCHQSHTTTTDDGRPATPDA